MPSLVNHGKIGILTLYVATYLEQLVVYFKKLAEKVVFVSVYLVQLVSSGQFIPRKFGDGKKVPTLQTKHGGLLHVDYLYNMPKGRDCSKKKEKRQV